MNPKRSPWSLEMGTVASIPIRVHATFLVLLVWLAFGTGAPSPLREAGYVILVFTCVLIHELSHALMAKRFGVQTKEITLYLWRDRLDHGATDP
jgi:Zn-dependent protease